MTEICELDVHDDRALREFYDVEVAAHAIDRPHAVNRTFLQLRQTARKPSPYFRRVLLVVRENDRIVGTADLGLSQHDKEVHREDHLVLELPYPPERLAPLPSGVDGYEIVTWTSRAPDEVMDAYAVMLTQMGTDHPTGEIDHTPVMPEHRGHGLGLALKTTVLGLLSAHHPERRKVHTWNAVDNAFMQRINRELGFRAVELEVEMQRKDAGG